MGTEWKKKRDAVLSRRVDEIMEQKEKLDDPERMEARKILVRGAIERTDERHTDAVVASEVEKALWRSKAREAMFPRGLPSGHNVTHIIKCLSCGNHILYHSGAPFSQTGKLSLLKCKKCWKPVPYGNADCKTYDKKAVVSIDEEIETVAKRLREAATIIEKKGE